MPEEERQYPEQDPQEIQAFLQRLSRDKHAFGAHLGMHVDRNFTRLQAHELHAAKKRESTPDK